MLQGRHGANASRNQCRRVGVWRKRVNELQARLTTEPRVEDPIHRAGAAFAEELAEGVPPDRRADEIGGRWRLRASMAWDASAGRRHADTEGGEAREDPRERELSWVAWQAERCRRAERGAPLGAEALELLVVETDQQGKEWLCLLVRENQFVGDLIRGDRGLRDDQDDGMRAFDRRDDLGEVGDARQRIPLVEPRSDPGGLEARRERPGDTLVLRGVADEDGTERSHGEQAHLLRRDSAESGDNPRLSDTGSQLAGPGLARGSSAGTFRSERHRVWLWRSRAQA